jgi:hypothetical protein
VRKSESQTYSTSAAPPSGSYTTVMPVSKTWDACISDTQHRKIGSSLRLHRSFSSLSAPSLRVPDWLSVQAPAFAFGPQTGPAKSIPNSAAIFSSQGSPGSPQARLKQHSEPRNSIIAFSKSQLNSSAIREGSRRARGVRLSLCSEDSSTASRLAWVLAKCPSSVQGGIALLGPCAIAKATSG